MTDEPRGVRDKIPDGVVVTMEVQMISWIDPETGGIRYTLWHEGEGLASGAIGLLLMGAMDLRELMVYGKEE